MLREGGDQEQELMQGAKPQPIAKIITEEDFCTVCGQLDALSKDPQAPVKEKNELKTKLENYIRKTVVDLCTKPEDKDDKKEKFEKM